MGMSIYNNIPSMNSQNALRMNQGDLSKSLERLSSGLRINRASDDASGLAISEKMRGQIRGLDRAVSNAQDGISLIQTAEGALNETTSILQRMRELSVQASNGTYTSNDRQEIQKEVDQLKGEIDRISTSTEFNTKKLLNGDATARWSTSDADKMEAIIRDTVASGNYRIDVTARVGQNQVLKSDIMTLKDGAFAADILTANGVVNSGDISSANSSGIAGIKAAEGLRSGEIDERTYRISVASVSSGGSISGSSAGLSSTETYVGSQADVVAVNGYFQQTGSNWGVTAITTAGTMSSTDGDYVAPDTDGALVAQIGSAGANLLTTGAHGYLEVEFLNDIQVNSSGGSVGDSTTAARARFIDVKTGSVGEWADVEVSDNGELKVGAATINGTLSDGTTADVFAAGAATIQLGTGDKVIKGDKMLLTLDDAVKNSLPGTGAATMSSGAGAIKVDERFDDGATGSVRELRGAFYVATAAEGIQNTILTNGAKDITYHIAQLDEQTGSITVGSLTLEMNANQNGTQRDGDVNAEIRGTDGLASAYTKLSDINSFITPDGTNVFNVSQKMTLYGNGTQTDIYLEADDTLADLVDKFKTAITDKDKGLGITMDSVVTDNKVAEFISKGGGVANTDAAVEGTLLLRSLFAGAQGELSVVADQKVLDALNLTEIQAAEENVYTVNVYDAHTGRAVGSDVVGDGTMEDVIKGTDISFKGNIGITATWDSSKAEFSYTAASTPETMYLHLVDNSIDFQIGANEGQTMNTGIAQVDVKSLGLDNVLLVDQKLAQEAITKVDKALVSVNSERSKLGAVSNRLDHTINSLSVAGENLQASESRIRDVDIAKEMAKFTSKQLLSQAAQSMLSQANQLPQGLMQLLR